MSSKKDWNKIFGAVKIEPHESLKSWFLRIEKKSGETFDSLRAAWQRYGRHLYPELAALYAPPGNHKPDFEKFTFSEQYQIPEGIDESKPPFFIEAKKMLILSDIHFPFQDRAALMTAIDQGNDADTVILNGDIMDCYSESKFTKNPVHRMLKKELDLVRDFLEYLRSRFRKSRIIYKFGNHDKRHQDYIFRNADALSDLPELLLPALLGFNIHGIEEAHHTQLIKCGSLNILHGHEHGGGGIINTGRNALLKSFDNIIISHFHTHNTYTVRRVGGDLLGAWATGCLCKLQPEYRPFNHWAHGAATVEFAGNKFHVNNFKIMEGKIL